MSLANTGRVEYKVSGRMLSVISHLRHATESQKKQQESLQPKLAGGGGEGGGKTAGAPKCRECFSGSVSLSGVAPGVKKLAEKRGTDILRPARKGWDRMVSLRLRKLQQREKKESLTHSDPSSLG